MSANSVAVLFSFKKVLKKAFLGQKFGGKLFTYMFHDKNKLIFDLQTGSTNLQDFMLRYYDLGAS